MRTVLAAALLTSSTAYAQSLPVEEFTLDNGMTFLLYPRDEQPNQVAAGWLAKVGSTNERPGITGISHFFEHMMFKGTHTIGTSDAQKDMVFRQEQERVREKLRTLQQTVNYDRYRKGEIDDPWDPANDTEEMAALRTELNKLVADHKEIIVKDEFTQVYTENGGTGMNAFTSWDITFYFITVPSNKVELWAWMESDRLDDSVFREFYSERDVVHEERRMRVESTPTGVYDEQFDAMFWGSSPYSWPVIGWPSDLNSYTMDQAQAYFDTYYAPNNLVGVLVGDFEPAEVKPLIEKYFSRLEASDPAPPVVTTEVEQKAEKRMDAECDCPPAIEVRYHAVPDGHADSAALYVMAEVLNGRTGRLYKSMVEGSEIATSAGTRADPRLYEGAFSFYAEGKADTDPSQLETAWYAQLKRLQDEPISETELQKVKNQVQADSYRRLSNNMWIMIQLGFAERMGDWRRMEEEPKLIAAVTAEDVQRVANEYFDETNRAVASYRRSADAAPIDPVLSQLLADLPPEAHGMVKAQIKQLEGASAEDLKAAIPQMEAQAGQVPAPMKPVFDYMLDKARKRLAEQDGGGK